MGLRAAVRNAIIGSMRAVLGRRYFFRVSEALSYAARGETENDPQKNGEAEVCRIAAEMASETEALVCLDVGANVGNWTRELLAARGGRAVVVHAFEPAPPACGELLKNLQPAITDGRVRVCTAAAGATEGTARFFVRSNSLISSMLDFGDSTATLVGVAATTLDRYAEQNGIRHIHFLKIDAEGYDLEVLRGARGLLSNRRVAALQFEYNFRWIYARNYLRDVFELLQPLGYDLGKITPRGVEFYRKWVREMESFHETNFLACLPEVRGRFRQISPPWDEESR